MEIHNTAVRLEFVKCCEALEVLADLVFGRVWFSGKVPGWLGCRWCVARKGWVIYLGKCLGNVVHLYCLRDCRGKGSVWFVGGGMCAFASRQENKKHLEVHSCSNFFQNWCMCLQKFTFYCNWEEKLEELRFWMFMRMRKWGLRPKQQVNFFPPWRVHARKRKRRNQIKGWHSGLRWSNTKLLFFVIKGVYNKDIHIQRTNMHSNEHSAR